MKNNPKRTPNKFAGQQDGTELAQWLNAEEPASIGARRDEHRSDTRTLKRIAQLIRDLNASAEKYIRQGKPDAELVSRIDRELSRHALRVTTFHVQDEG